jgi:hypothetical protein
MKAYFVLLSIEGMSTKYYVHAKDSVEAIAKALKEITSELGDDISISCKLTVPVRE